MNKETIDEVEYVIRALKSLTTEYKHEAKSVGEAIAFLYRYLDVIKHNT